MNPMALQRVVVRMLHDAPFADAVYADPARALAGVPLSDRERAWLVAGDRRAWGTDPMRRHRGLQALLEEYPVSAAVLAAEGFPVGDHDAFFSGPRFHVAIQTRGSLAEAFGEHLAALATSALAEGVVAIERALAAVRRRHAAAWRPGANFRLSGRYRVVRAAIGTLDAYVALDAALRADGHAPLERLLSGTFNVPAVEVASSGEEALLVEAAAGDEAGALSFATDELALLLEAALPGAADALLREVLGGLGLSTEEATELLGELVADGLLEIALAQA